MRGAKRTGDSAILIDDLGYVLTARRATIENNRSSVSGNARHDRYVIGATARLLRLDSEFLVSVVVVNIGEGGGNGCCCYCYI